MGRRGTRTLGKTETERGLRCHFGSAEELQLLDGSDQREGGENPRGDRAGCSGDYPLGSPQSRAAARRCPSRRFAERKKLEIVYHVDEYCLEYKEPILSEPWEGPNGRSFAIASCRPGDS